MLTSPNHKSKEYTRALGRSLFLRGGLFRRAGLAHMRQTVAGTGAGRYTKNNDAPDAGKGSLRQRVRKHLYKKQCTYG